MKKNSTLPIVVFLTHLFICLFFSFDWTFLEGIYMGFGWTFLIIWGLTIPVVTACIDVVGVVCQVKKKLRLSFIEIVSAVIGGILLLLYVTSALGILKNFAFSFIYIFVFVGTLFIWSCWAIRKLKRSRKRGKGGHL